MSLLAAYTFAKSIDLSSERGNGDRGGGFDTGGGNVRDRNGYARGRSGFDVRHRLAVSTVYELPLGRGQMLLKDASAGWSKVVGGWAISGIALYQGGFPTTAVMSADINGDGIADRPDFVAPLGYNTRNPDCYIIDSRNPACGASTSSFVDLPAGSTRFGSAGRNIISGPGLVNWDAGLAKNTRFGTEGRYNVQFRWEVFNLFNRANFNQPSRVVNVVSPRFGTITSAARAREMQFGLKLEF
jgi:hypothetical protein